MLDVPPSIAGILPTLDFFARFLYGLSTNISTICVIFNGHGRPFLFRSTLAKPIVDTDVRTGQSLLAQASESADTILPLVPPCHQRKAAKHIREG